MDVVDRARARVGATLLAKWHLDELIGVGGMAAVYAATHRNGSRGAVKMLHPELSIDSLTKRRFLREGYVANTVDHPGVVRAVDDDTAEDGSVFIVMDLLDGDTLDAAAQEKGGKLAARDLLPIVDQLLDVLAAAHVAGVVHRDIKPENVFITRDGTIKLLDFGVARQRSVNAGSLATVTGAIFGTPAYMAPEQALGRNDDVDGQSDTWAVGATMFSLLTGRLVHEADTLNAQLVASASRHAPPVASIAPDVPAQVAAVVDRALAFAKADRWPDARAMQDALRAAQAELGWPVSTARFVATPGTKMGPRTFRRVGGDASIAAVTVGKPARRRLDGKWAIAAGAGGAVVLGGVVLALLARRSSPSATAAPEPSATATSATVAPQPQATAPVPVVNVAGTATAAASVAPPEASAAAPPTPPTAKPRGPAPRPRTGAVATGKPAAPSGDWLDKQH